MESFDAPPVIASNNYVFQLTTTSQRTEGSQICFAAQVSGLRRSLDGGKTWEPAYASLQTRDPLPTTSVVLAPDFQHDPAVFAGLNGAILCSYDGGVEWQRGRLPSPLPAISAMAISPNYEEDATVFAGTNEDGVLISQDRGRSWVAWNFGLLDLNILCLAISPDFALDETIFAGTQSGLFRSTNGGRAWREVPLPIPFDAVLCVAFSPGFSNDGTLLAGTENNGLLISRDCGRSWQCMSAAVAAAPINQILICQGTHSRAVLILLGEALHMSRDQGRTWQPWKTRRLGTGNITAVLRLNAPGAGTLVGYEDGRILRV